MLTTLPILGLRYYYFLLFLSHFRNSATTTTTTILTMTEATTMNTTTTTNTNTTTRATSLRSDEELIQQAHISFQEERLLEAARLLRQVRNTSLLEENNNIDFHFHRKLLESADVVEQATKELLGAPAVDGDWKKQGESSSGRYDSTIYYKLLQEVGVGAKLTCRAETPVPTSLLIPLLSVLNESGLYHTWIPSWKRPFRIGVRKSRQLLHDTRGHQIIQVQCDVPWPMASREVLMDVIAVDDIDANGFIIAKMRTLDESNCPLGFTIPPPERNMERTDYDGAVLFRACPTHHPNYAGARSKFPDDDLILLQFSVFFDGHMAFVPTALINFVTRTVIGRIWDMLLSVAEQVREGTRKEHGEVIREKADFYKWVEERCQVMIQDMKSATTSTSTSTSTTSDAKDGGVTETATAKTCRHEEQEDWTMNDVMKITL
jgi:hypothetical protein